MDDETLSQFEKGKHCFPIPCKNRIIYRMRFKTVGARLGRLFYCHGEGVKNRGNIDDKSIVLLYISSDEEEHDDYKDVAQSLDDLLNDNNTNINEFNEKIKIISNKNLTYESIVNDERKQLYFSPVLSDKQYSLMVNNCIYNPPSVIYGAAGTGKTLISARTYEQLIKECNYSTSDILYVTFMGRLKREVKEQIIRLNIKNPNCYTIKELIYEILAKNNIAKLYADENTFIKWTKSDEFYRSLHQNNANINHISEDIDNALKIVYIFFRTYRDKKYYFSNDPNDNNPKSYDTLLNSFNDKIKNENLKDRAKENIYKICKMYEEYLNENNLITDNIAANMIVEKHLRKYKAIIIDEVQDLTLIQIKALRSLLKDDSKSFIAFGDDNQTINPSLLRLSSVSEYITKEFRLLSPNNPEPLTESFRSSKYLIDYINYLNKTRSLLIGTDKQYNEVIQKSHFQSVKNNESDKPALIKNNKVENELLLNNSIWGLNNVVIIVPNNKVKNELISKYPYFSKKDDFNETIYIKTVEETKGCEWDIVVLYDFFSSDKKIWNYLCDIKNNNLPKSHSTIDRMYFNRYYVALTRAKNKVLILENENLEKNILELFTPIRIKNSDNKSHRILNVINDETGCLTYFENDHTAEIWHKKAKDSFEAREYEDAYNYEIRAINVLTDDEFKLYSQEYNRLKDIYKLYYDFTILDTISKVDIDKYLKVFLEQQDKESVKELYRKANDKNKNLLFDDETNYNYFLNLYKKLDKEEKLSSCEKELLFKKVINAYSQKINNQMEEIINGQR